MIFHTGWRKWFPFVSEAISKVIPLDRIRHIGYSHFEGDESGAMNEFLAVAPQAVPFASRVSVMTSLNDQAERAARGLADSEVFSTGEKTWQWIDTPHVPHGWDCGVMFDQSTGTLFCGDLFTQPGAETPPVTESEILTASEAMRKPMDYYAHSTRTTNILERLSPYEIVGWTAPCSLRFDEYRLAQCVLSRLRRLHANSVFQRSAGETHPTC